MRIWTRVDEALMPQHYFLEDTDICIFHGEYVKGAGYTGRTNSLIHNLKKKPSAPHQNYKATAIKDCANLLEAISPKALQSQTFVPVPPSKAIGHPDYDNRLTRILNLVNTAKLDVRELVYQKASLSSSHTSSDRTSISDLIKNYCIDESLTEPQPSNIIIFDDVLTTGRHFKAMQTVMRNRFPDSEIRGLFIARRLVPTE